MKIYKQLISALALMAAFGHPLLAQQALYRGGETMSPEVHEDHTVTFRIQVAGVEEVSLIGDWMPAEGWIPGSVVMEKEENGLWSYTTAELEPELYGYSFMIDGVRANDPNNVFVSRDIATNTNILLVDGGRLVSFIVDLSPLPNNQDQILLKKFKDMAGAILIGNGFGGLIQGVAGGAVFSFFGLPSPFLWGVIMGLLAFLPIIGIGIVFIPAAIYLFLKGRIGASIFFIVFYVVLSGGVEYFFKPKLVGQRVKMHTLLVFLAIIGGLKLFGILGIIYGPLVITAFLTLTDIYRSNYQTMVNPLGVPLKGTPVSECHESNKTEI